MKLVVKNYKEPLKAIPSGKGFGYYGAVSQSEDGDYIQCHLCGGLFRLLSAHIFSKHHMQAREYKTQFKLAYITPLASDSYREHMKQKTLKWLASLTPEQIQHIRANSRKGREKWDRPVIQTFNQLETLNKRGVCPDQLIEKIKECASALHKTPSKREFHVWCKTQRYIHAIYKTFGSYTKALQIAKLAPRTIEYPKTHIRAYGNEELLEYLRVFYRETGKIPTHTDFLTGDLPNYGIYLVHFGSLNEARERAGIPKFIPSSRSGTQYNQTI